MTPTILVVEDEPAIRELLKVNLVDAGYEVHEAEDAETAQSALHERLPDLLLLDWMLPGQSGLALARRLRGDTRTRDLPIIMLTARSDEADKVAGLEAWVDDYVTKPFSPRELKARIKAWGVYGSTIWLRPIAVTMMAVIIMNHIVAMVLPRREPPRAWLTLRAIARLRFSLTASTDSTMRRETS